MKRRILVIAAFAVALIGGAAAPAMADQPTHGDKQCKGNFAGHHQGHFPGVCDQGH
jgi:Spy/CpxP family protein refolding chaperone